METALRMGCVQMCSRTNPNDNLKCLGGFIKKAVEENVSMLFSPEAVLYMPHNHQDHWKRGWYFSQDTHKGLQEVCTMIAEAKIWFVLGSLAVLLPDKKLVNRSFVIAPDGSIKGYYDKIHLFDAMSLTGFVYEESQKYQHGEHIALIKTPWGQLGIGLCYDLRFPHLFHTMASQGACFLTIPSAFTRDNGRLHWSILLRSRAIETGSYVFAPAQSGFHENGRETYGHSMIVSPWGDILASTYDDREQMIVAEIDPEEVVKARAMLPVLKQSRTNLPVKVFS